MNYEEKYKEALRQARVLFETTEDVSQQNWLCNVFPELRESEDEQHRKWILEYLYDGLRKSDEQFKGQFKTAIAWLEKQGEQKPVWNEEDERERERVVNLLKGWLSTFKETHYAKDCKCGIAWLESIKERRTNQ